MTAHLASSGVATVGTSRRPQGSAEILLDLGADLSDWSPPESVDAAIICAGISRLAECERYPELARRINVEGTLALIDRLLVRGVYVVYLSSSTVFDGSAPKRLSSETQRPVNEYGRHKAEVEKRLLELGADAAVLRLAKALGPRDRLFAEWRNALRNGRGIVAFEDMTLSPIPLFCVVAVLSRILIGRHTGIFQLSGSIDLSYADAARIGAHCLGQPVSKVLGVPSRTKLDPGLQIPRYTSLDTSRVEELLEVTPPSVEWTVEAAFVRPEALTQHSAPGKS